MNDLDDDGVKNIADSLDYPDIHRFSAVSQHFYQCLKEKKVDKATDYFNKNFQNVLKEVCSKIAQYMNAISPNVRTISLVNKPDCGFYYHKDFQRASIYYFLLNETYNIEGRPKNIVPTFKKALLYCLLAEEYRQSYFSGFFKNETLKTSVEQKLPQNILLILKKSIVSYGFTASMLGDLQKEMSSKINTPRDLRIPHPNHIAGTLEFVPEPCCVVSPVSDEAEVDNFIKKESAHLYGILAGELTPTASNQEKRRYCAIL